MDEENLIIKYLDNIKNLLGDLSTTSKTLTDNADNASDYTTIRSRKKLVTRQLSKGVVDISNSRYIRDDRRIILSAPEIIIGNIDKSGNLIDSSNNNIVVIRSNEVSIEGVSGTESKSTGKVITRAPKIHTIAVEPGIDGNENYLNKDVSEVLTLARGVEVRSESGESCFTRATNKKIKTGVNIESQEKIRILSIAQNATTAKELGERKTALADRISISKEKISGMLPPLEKLLEDMRYMANAPIYSARSRKEVASHYTEIDDANRRLESFTIGLMKQVEAYYKEHSLLFEMMRESNYISAEIQKLEKTHDNFFKDTTHSSIDITAPQIQLNTEDGEGNFRDDGHIHLRSKSVGIYGCKDHFGSLEKSKFKIRFNDVRVDTNNLTKKDDVTQSTSSGNVTLSSKYVAVKGESFDKKSDGTIENIKIEDASSFKVLHRNVSINTNGEKATTAEAGGLINMSSKLINIGSLVAPEDKTSVIADSNLFLLSENIEVGRSVRTLNGDPYLLSSKVVNLFSSDRIQNTSASIQQYTSKDMTQVTLTDSNVTNHISMTDSELSLFAPSKAILYVDKKEVATFNASKITFTPDVELKSPLAATAIAANDVTASSLLKGPNYTEGTSANKTSQSGSGGTPNVNDANNSKQTTDDIPQSRKDADAAYNEYTEKRDNLEKLRLDYLAADGQKSQYNLIISDLDLLINLKNDTLQKRNTEYNDAKDSVERYKKYFDDNPEEKSNTKKVDRFNNMENKVKKCEENIKALEKEIEDKKGQKKESEETLTKLVSEIKTAYENFLKAGNEFKEAETKYDTALVEAEKDEADANK